MGFEVTELDHLAIRVSDLEEALDFYHGTLGLSIRDRERYESGEVPFVSVVIGGRHLHLFPVDDPGFQASGTSYGNEHIAIIIRSDSRDRSEQMDEIVEELHEQGVSIAGLEEFGSDVEDDSVDDDFVLGEEMLDRDTYGAYGYGLSTYIRDPDGRTIELKLQ